MSSVNEPNRTQDLTTTIFDDFYNFSVTVDTNSYDLVLSYFKSIFGDSLAAKNFTVNFFQISETNGVSVEELLEQIGNQNQIELSATFSYYLNNLRSNSTLLGISTPVTPSIYAARNVLP